MTIDYLATMPRRKMSANPEGRNPVMEHALEKDSPRSICGIPKEDLENLHHEWNPTSPNSCKKCLRGYPKST